MAGPVETVGNQAAQVNGDPERTPAIFPPPLNTLPVDPGSIKSGSAAIPKSAWDLGVRPNNHVDLNPLLKDELDRKIAMSVVADINNELGKRYNLGMIASQELIEDLSPRQAQKLGMLTLKISKEVAARKAAGFDPDRDAGKNLPVLAEEEQQLEQARGFIGNLVAKADNYDQLEALADSRNPAYEELPFVNDRKEWDLLETMVAEKAQTLHKASGAKEITAKEWRVGVRPEGYVDISKLRASELGRHVMTDLYGSDGTATLILLYNKMNLDDEILSEREGQRLQIASQRIKREKDRRDELTQHGTTTIPTADVLLPQQEAALVAIREQLPAITADLNIADLISSGSMEKVLKGLPYVDGSSEKQLLKQAFIDKAQAIYLQHPEQGITFDEWQAGARMVGFVPDYNELRSLPDKTILPYDTLLGPQDAYLLRSFEDRLHFKIKPLSALEATQYSEFTQRVRDGCMAAKDKLTQPN